MIMSHSGPAIGFIQKFPSSVLTVKGPRMPAASSKWLKLLNLNGFFSWSIAVILLPEKTPSHVLRSRVLLAQRRPAQIPRPL